MPFSNNRKIKLKYKIFIFILIFILLFTLCAVYFDNQITPVILSLSEAEVKQIAKSCISSAIVNIFPKYSYEDLVSVKSDLEGNVTLIQANTSVINLMAREVAQLAKNNLNEISDSVINVPIGAFTGSTVIASLGPEISLKIKPVGNVQCQFYSEFHQAGINQTRHRIYVEIQTEVVLVIPVKAKNISTNTQLLISENIIVGKVPDTYLNTQDYSEAIDFIP